MSRLWLRSEKLHPIPSHPIPGAQLPCHHPELFTFQVRWVPCSPSSSDLRPDSPNLLGMTTDNSVALGPSRLPLPQRQRRDVLYIKWSGSCDIAN